MYILPFDIVQYIYSFDDNIIVIKNKKKSIIELKSRFGHYRYNYNICISDISYEAFLYNNCYIRKYNQYLSVHKYILLRNIKLKKRIKNGDKSIIIQIENHRLHNFLPTRAIINLN